MNFPSRIYSYMYEREREREVCLRRVYSSACGLKNEKLHCMELYISASLMSAGEYIILRTRTNY